MLHELVEVFSGPLLQLPTWFGRWTADDSTNDCSIHGDADLRIRKTPDVKKPLRTGMAF